MFTVSRLLATDATVTLAKLLPVGPLMAKSFCPKITTGFPWQSVIRLASPCTLGYSAATQGRTSVNSKRDSLSRVTLQAHDLCCRTRLTPLLTLRHNRQARQPQSTHCCLWLGHRLRRRSPLTLSCALFRRCLPLLAIVPLPPAVACIVLPVKSVDGLRRVWTVLVPVA